MSLPAPPAPSTLVLLSGGLDSAVLLAHEAAMAPVAPVYVSVGLAWESMELEVVEQLLAHESLAGRVAPLVSVSFSMRDVYGPAHWAVRGTPPAYDTPDEAVFLTGRNLVLLAKAGIVAATLGARRVALGPLAGNPFPDARPVFFSAMSEALSLGLDHPIEVAAPFLTWRKTDVISRGFDLQVPFERTLSCMNPVASASPAGLPAHCGRCSKCRERRDAFAELGRDDPATYATPAPR